ncbi:hypothetical protein SIN01_01580 [Sporolactobacillus inulinus]|nr:hypothetical protein SIN01_01580 [Sporolactobacillus inulinus]
MHAVAPVDASSWNVIQAKIDGSKPHSAEVNRRRDFAYQCEKRESGGFCFE